MAESPNELAEELGQHPEVAVMLTSFTGLILALLLGSLIAWISLIGRMRRGQPVLSMEPWTPRVWGLLDLLLIVGLVIVGQGIGIKLWSASTGIGLGELRQEGDIPLSAMAAISVSYIAAMLVTVAWFAIRYGSSLAHVGLFDKKFKSNLLVGAVAGLVSLPVVYTVMAIVSSSLSDEYEHPLLDQMAKEGSMTAFLLAAFCAVVAAPITEEFFFRVMLQGWLQSIPWSGKNLRWLTGASQRERGTELTHVELTHAELIGTELSGTHASPLPRIAPEASLSGELSSDHVYPSAPSAPQNFQGQSSLPEVALPPMVDSSFGEPRDAAPATTSPAPPLWPVFVSGSLFGLAHWGYGLSFIPLIMLGIVLGLLYRAKHSIWPSLIVHFMLNSVSMLSLGMSMLVKSISQ